MYLIDRTSNKSVEETDGELLEVVVVVHEVRDLEDGPVMEFGALAVRTQGPGDDVHACVLHADTVRTLYSF